MVFQNSPGNTFLRAECPDALVIRTCGLYGVWGSGGKGGNFVETMMRLAREGKPIRVVNDQRCTPSYTVDVANATVSLIHAGADWAVSRDECRILQSGMSSRTRYSDSRV